MMFMMLEPRTPGDVIACEMRLSALVLLARALYGTQGPTEVEDRCCGDLVKACSTPPVTSRGYFLETGIGGAQKTSPSCTRNLRCIRRGTVNGPVL
jgi:hypothetical protein